MKNIAKKGLLYALMCLVVIAVCRVAITPSPAGEERRVLYTAGQIVDRIKKHVTCDWQKETVDTYKAGNPNTPVTGLACTFMATFDVLKRASKTGVCGKYNNVTIFNKKEKEAKRKKRLPLQNTTLKN
jgi:hypothetical protein